MRALTRAAWGLTCALCCTLALADDTDNAVVRWSVPSQLSPEDAVVVVDRPPSFRFMVAGGTIVGAQFLSSDGADGDTWLQPTFSAFAIMQAAGALRSQHSRRTRNVLQLGLGTGAVPSYFRASKARVDVVELDGAIVDVARRFFHYRDTGIMRTIVADAGDVINSRQVDSPTDAAPFGKRRYDLVFHDIFSAVVGDAYDLVTQDFMATIKRRWLRKSPTAVLVMNVVGFTHGPHAAVPLQVWNDLAATFSVLRCFRDIPVDTDQHIATNLIFFASDGAIEFDRDDVSSGSFRDAWTQVPFEDWELHRNNFDVTSSASPVVGSTIAAQNRAKVSARPDAAIDATAAAQHHANDDTAASVPAIVSPDGDVTTNANKSWQQRYREGAIAAHASVLRTTRSLLPAWVWEEC